ncbi:MAG: DEAD/DEAH box helicase family protein [Candidatus Bathyarchaeota archaeon]|nr:DEAD/DEAH box helicase family protein [Candidatus Bathyarchaeota archaeon]
MSDTATRKIDRLIINNPYEAPKEHWERVQGTTSYFRRVPGRRSAGYIKAGDTKNPDDPGVFIPIELVNQIRERVDKWREDGYPGVTGTTHRLFEHWHNPQERDHQFFYCQLEAIETIIWLTESPPSSREGLIIPGDGGPFHRLCCKMATGTGKTTVMAMLAAWQILNNVASSEDSRYTRFILILTPNLTIRNRLQVLKPDEVGNYFDEFNVVPYDLREHLRQGKLKVTNWHNLAWDDDEKLKRRRSVDKRGALSDEAYTREVLGELAQHRRLLIINDEAHHAWRRPAGTKYKLDKEEEEIATVWINGLDRINKTRGIHTCYDFTATPFAPTGKASPEETLYPWIISDFNLNDAIESGLVKTPRIVFRDDAVPDKSYRSKLYHIYAQPEVHGDLNRPADPEEPLPSLVENAYWLLSEDWLAAFNQWKAEGFPTPPVMISIANRTETAARIKHAFDNNNFHIDELANPDTTIHIDSKILKADIEGEEITPQEEEKEEEPVERKLTKKEQEDIIRRKVDTVGKRGQPGEQIRNVISVGMLSEGWDCRTVTHIMGLRAFTSQLLCEQVVGRGLRRTSYDVDPATGLFDPEYVNIFGVPFSFLPHETEEGRHSKPPKARFPIEPSPAKNQHELRIPNVTRVDHVFKPNLTLDINKLTELTIDAIDIRTQADMAPMIEGKPNITQLTTIQLKELAERNRTQRLVFEAAKRLYDQMKGDWGGDQISLISQLIHILEEFMAKGKIRIKPPDWDSDDFKRRIAMTLSLPTIINHVYQHIRLTSTERLEPQFNQDRPLIWTGDMRTWYTSKDRTDALKSHINNAVYDSRWEAAEAFELDRNPGVESWVKNDHLGFEIHYIHGGIHHKYRPDYIIRLANGTHLIVEVKGQPTQQDRSKEIALQEWIQAVNTQGGFGKWLYAQSTHPKDIKDIIEKALKTP